MYPVRITGEEYEELLQLRILKKKLLEVLPRYHKAEAESIDDDAQKSPYYWLGWLEQDIKLLTMLVKGGQDD